MSNQQLFEKAAQELRNFRLTPYAKEPPEHIFSKAYQTSLNRQYTLYAETVLRSRLQERWKHYAVMGVGLVAGLALCWICVQPFAPLLLGTDAAPPEPMTQYSLVTPPQGYRLWRLKVTADTVEGTWQDEALTRIGFRQTPNMEDIPTATGEQVPVWGSMGLLYGDETGAALRWSVDGTQYTLWSEADGNAPQALVGGVAPWTRMDYPTDKTPLSQLPADYAPATAKAEGCMVLTAYSVENEQMLTDFISLAEQEKTGFLRICDYRSGITLLELHAEKDGIRMLRDNSRVDESYEEGVYQRMSLLDIGGNKTLLLYAMGDTEPVQALQYTLT